MLTRKNRCVDDVIIVQVDSAARINVVRNTDGPAIKEPCKRRESYDERISDSIQ